MEPKTYLVNQATNEKYILNGCIPSESNFEGKSFGDYSIYETTQLPVAVDLRPFMTPVEQQGRTSSCVANALAGTYEYLLKRHQSQDIDVSRLFLYYNARVRSNPGQPVVDRGCSIYKAVQSLQIDGTCLEKDWPFYEAYVNNPPHRHLYQAAKSNVITEAVALDVDLDQMRTCLAQGYPFVFGLKLFRSFSLSRVNDGFVSTPQLGEPPLGQHNLHAMLAVGYSDRHRLFVVRNSWGPQWGEKGYIYIPYDYLSDRRYCSEVATIRKLNNMDLGREHWINEASQFAIGEPTDFGGSADEEVSKWTVQVATDEAPAVASAAPPEAEAAPEAEASAEAESMAAEEPSEGGDRQMQRNPELDFE